MYQTPHAAPSLKLPSLRQPSTLGEYTGTSCQSINATGIAIVSMVEALECLNNQKGLNLFTTQPILEIFLPWFFTVIFTSWLNPLAYCVKKNLTQQNNHTLMLDIFPIFIQIKLFSWHCQVNRPLWWFTSDKKATNKPREIHLQEVHSHR